MGSKHGAEPCFRNCRGSQVLPRRSLKTVMEVVMLPRRSYKTVVEVLSFHDSLQRPLWKPGASTMVSI
ncbi:hypothetical protein TIFTF001_033743 [Ficus carica]|uniref:Uncharacterized protein n=1 Tax=Ficus carica TaxID=3494 RepID=A0AA88DZU2_FICCA|nr:hypothetical protein TIFTF001_033743 [Ficus carica]